MSYIPQVSRDGVTLRASTLAIGTSYDASPTALRAQNWNQLQLFLDLTLATATDVRVKIEFASPVGDATPAAGDWFQQSEADSGAATRSGLTSALPLRVLEWVLPATGKFILPVQLNYKWVRVSAKTTGGPGATTLAVFATQGLA